METFLIALLVFGVAISAMAIGAMVARKPIKGTCGGLNNLRDRFDAAAPCDICGDDPSKQPVECSTREKREKRELDPLGA